MTVRRIPDAGNKAGEAPVAAVDAAVQQQRRPMISRGAACLAAISLLALMPQMAMAAEIDGRTLSAWWALPFAGMLLSIAIMPLAIPHIWHHHFGKIAAGWALLLLVPFAMTQGVGLTAGMLVHVLLAEYIPFIVLLTALFTVAGGIYVRGNLHGSPGLNTAIMGIGAVLASFMGTTGRVHVAHPSADPRQ